MVGHRRIGARRIGRILTALRIHWQSSRTNGLFPHPAGSGPSDSCRKVTRESPATEAPVRSYSSLPAVERFLDASVACRMIVATSFENRFIPLRAASDVVCLFICVCEEDPWRQSDAKTNDNFDGRPVPCVHGGEAGVAIVFR
jgi:hypothetical protein